MPPSISPPSFGLVGDNKVQSVRRVAVTLIAGATVLACVTGVGAAGFSGAPTATEVTTTVAGRPTFDAVDFFTEFFGGINADPRRPGEVVNQVVEGSPADLFVEYLYGFGAARRLSRQGPLESFTVSGDDTSVEVCNAGFCDTFGDFVVVDGLLQSFRLNGVSIDGRLAAPIKLIERGPVRIRVVGAFERVTVDELAVVIALEAGSEPLEFNWAKTTYVDPSWTPIEVDLPASAFPPNIEPGGEREIVLQFPTAGLGGEVVLTYTAESSGDPITFRVPIEAAVASS
jgi:hypothetical protein